MSPCGYIFFSVSGDALMTQWFLSSSLWSTESLKDFLKMNCTPTSSALILLTLPILIQWLSYGTYMGFMMNRRTGQTRGRPISTPMTLMKPAKNDRRAQFFSRTGSGTRTSPGSTRIRSSKCGISTSFEEMKSSRLSSGKPLNWATLQVSWTASSRTAPIALTGTCRSVPFARTTMWLTSSESGSAMTWTISPTSPSTHWTLDLILGCRLAMALVSGDRLLLDGLGGLNRGVLQRRQIRHERVDLLIRHEFLVLVRHELLIVFLLKALGHPRPGSEQFFLHLFGLHQVADVVQHRPALLDRALPADLVAVVTLLELVLLLAERDQVPADCHRCDPSGRPTADRGFDLLRLLAPQRFQPFEDGLALGIEFFRAFQQLINFAFFGRRQLGLDNLLDLSFFDHGIVLRERAGAGNVDQRDHHVKSHQQGHRFEAADGRERRRVQQDKDGGPEESIENKHDLKHRGEVEEIPGRHPKHHGSHDSLEPSFDNHSDETSLRLHGGFPYSAPATAGIPFAASAWAFSFPVRSVRTIAKLTMM